MESYEVYYECPGSQASDVIIVKDNKEETILKHLEEMTGYNVNRIKIISKDYIPLEKIRIRDLDAQSFLNLIKGGLTR